MGGGFMLTAGVAVDKATLDFDRIFSVLPDCGGLLRDFGRLQQKGAVRLRRHDRRYGAGDGLRPHDRPEPCRGKQ